MSHHDRYSPYDFAHGLYKDKENAWIFGVCAGIAEYGDFRVGMVRLIAFISLWFFSGMTILAYLLAAALFQVKPLRFSGSYAEQEFWKRNRGPNYWRQS